MKVIDAGVLNKVFCGVVEGVVNGVVDGVNGEAVCLNSNQRISGQWRLVPWIQNGVRLLPSTDP